MRGNARAATDVVTRTHGTYAGPVAQHGDNAGDSNRNGKKVNDTVQTVQ